MNIISFQKDNYRVKTFNGKKDITVSLDKSDNKAFKPEYKWHAQTKDDNLIIKSKNTSITFEGFQSHFNTETNHTHQMLDLIIENDSQDNKRMVLEFIGKNVVDIHAAKKQTVH